MKHSAMIAIGAAALACAACKKKASEGGGGGGGTAAPGTAAATAARPRPEPFTGALTVDRVLGARDLVKPFDPWDDGFAKLQALLGVPTKIDGARHIWGVVEGDACAYFYVTKDNGADYNVNGIIVGTVQTPARTTKDGTSGNHEECLKASGVAVGPPEDPAAAGPPADGSAVPLADLRKVVIPGRSKWNDQKVKVAATLGGVSTTSSGSDQFVTANLTAGVDDPDEPLSCSLSKNQTVPPALTQGMPVIAEGTMRIQEWTSMGSGGTTLKPSLADCRVTSALVK